MKATTEQVRVMDPVVVNQERYEQPLLLEHTALHALTGQSQKLGDSICVC